MLTLESYLYSFGMFPQFEVEQTTSYIVDKLIQHFVFLFFGFQDLDIARFTWIGLLVMLTPIYILSRKNGH